MPPTRSEEREELKEAARASEQRTQDLERQIQELQEQLRRIANNPTNPISPQQINGTGSLNISGNNEATATFKLTKFWKNSPDLWFEKIESTLRTRNLTADQVMYDAVIDALHETVILEVSDVIRAPPGQNKYTHLKENLVKRFTDSSERQLHKLLSEIQLGEQNPSQLLKKMKDLTKDKASEELIRTRWLGLLPNQVYNTLKVLRTATLNELLEVADSIMENNSHAVTSEVSNHQETGSANTIKTSEGKHLETRIASIEKGLAEVLALMKR